jgi:hypothetical protein
MCQEDTRSLVSCCGSMENHSQSTGVLLCRRIEHFRRFVSRCKCRELHIPDAKTGEHVKQSFLYSPAIIRLRYRCLLHCDEATGSGEHARTDE